MDREVLRMMAAQDRRLEASRLMAGVGSFLWGLVRLQLDILSERARWVAVRRHLGCGTLPGEAICEVLLMRQRRRAPWLKWLSIL